jgi:hypothetical protein
VTDPPFTPDPERELLAVFPDPQRAQAARTALLDSGLSDSDVRIDEDLDAVVSLRAEMHDEMRRAWVVPNAGVAYPAEAARGLAMVSVVAVAVGIAAAFPLALLDVGATYWLRWVVFAVVGAAFGLAVSLVIGPAGGAPRPGEQPAAARGTVLHVDRDTPVVRDVLLGHDPIRIDEISRRGDPLDVVLRERPDAAAETAKDISANASGDDYHPER